MTKSQEMQQFDSFIRSLPEDSYLQPWLKGIRDQVERDLQLDIIPQHSPGEIWERCQILEKESAARISKLKESAETEAAQIIEQARHAAQRLTDSAIREADDIRNAIRDDIHRLRNALNNLV